MGDVRGHEIDKKNFEQTIAYISEFDHINAICFLIKPNNVRLSPGLRYCFKELMSHLHKKTIKNLIFCFTNSRGNFFIKTVSILYIFMYIKNYTPKWLAVIFKLLKLLIELTDFKIFFSFCNPVCLLSKYI